MTRELSWGDWIHNWPTSQCLINTGTVLEWRETAHLVSHIGLFHMSINISTTVAVVDKRLWGTALKGIQNTRITSQLTIYNSLISSMNLFQGISNFYLGRLTAWKWAVLPLDYLPTAIGSSKFDIWGCPIQWEYPCICMCPHKEDTTHGQLYQERKLRIRS